MSQFVLKLFAYLNNINYLEKKEYGKLFSISWIIRVVALGV